MKTLCIILLLSSSVNGQDSLVFENRLILQKTNMAISHANTLNAYLNGIGTASIFVGARNQKNVSGAPLIFLGFVSLSTALIVGPSWVHFKLNKTQDGFNSILRRGLMSFLVFSGTAFGVSYISDHFVNDPKGITQAIIGVSSGIVTGAVTYVYYYLKDLKELREMANLDGIKFNMTTDYNPDFRLYSVSITFEF